MEDQTRRQRIASLLREAGAAHHQAFAHVNGDDPDWPAWYADHLREPLGRVLGRSLDAAQLAARLASLDREYRASQPDVAWDLFYAERLEFAGEED